MQSLDVNAVEAIRKVAELKHQAAVDTLLAQAAFAFREQASVHQAPTDRLQDEVDAWQTATAL